MNTQRCGRCLVVLCALGSVLSGASPAAAQPADLGIWSDAPLATGGGWQYKTFHSIHLPNDKFLFWQERADSAQLYSLAGVFEDKPFLPNR